MYDKLFGEQAREAAEAEIDWTVPSGEDDIEDILAELAEFFPDEADEDGYVR